MNQMNQKAMTKLLLIHWAGFNNELIEISGSTLFTGVNGSGKTTILDAMLYLLTGNTKFNSAAQDRERTVLSYVRGDTSSNGDDRYLRSGDIISYIAMEFYDMLEKIPFVIGVCIESPNDSTKPTSSWFICPKKSLNQIRFTEVVENKKLKVFPRTELNVGDGCLKASAFLGRDKGTEQVLRALGIRYSVTKYRSKLLKMMTFRPENNIGKFIQDCVLEEPEKNDSLQDLRQQKQLFDDMQQIYNTMSLGRKQLERVEQLSSEFENKKKQLEIRDLMLCYQELQQLKAEQKDSTQKAERLNTQLADLENKKQQLESEHQAAQERLRVAKSNDLNGMKESLENLDRQIETAEREIREYTFKLDEVRELECLIKDLMGVTGTDLTLDPNVVCYLERLSQSDIESTQQKTWAFQQFSDTVQEQNQRYEEMQIHLQDTIRNREEYMAALSEKIRLLTSNIMVYPTEIEEARKIIYQELKKQNIETNLSLFAELVQGFTDTSWRNAIECFLGNKRFNFFVDNAYYDQVVEIVQRKKLYHARIVVADTIRETDVAEQSAASVLKILNVAARKYANFLLNGVHLCDTLDDLHQHSTGGIMKNGMLAKSYVVSMMNFSKIRSCLGNDAIRIQLNQCQEELEELKDLQSSDKSKLAKVISCRKAITKIDFNLLHYDFDSASKLQMCQEKKVRFTQEQAEIRNNPAFVAILKEQALAQRQVQEAYQALSNNAMQIGSCRTTIGECTDRLSTIQVQIDEKQINYEKRSVIDLDRTQEMLREYSRLHERKPDSWLVISVRTVDNLRNELKEYERQVEDAQFEYCNIVANKVLHRGVQYISEYRKEYSDLEHVRIEEAQQKLAKQSKKLETAFMSDFILKIAEAMDEAKGEMDAINRELRQMPFGSDTYRFIMKEKADRATFFRISRRLHTYYMDSPEVYLNSNRDDDEMEQDIREFMKLILQEEDEEEFTDYRRYFSYDMEIISRQGDLQVTANLSKKQGSASNGEKQTPYFIILAASLLQCYPAESCCARLAFIDEAFSALSRERIEQMVKFLEENHFQVFYAAPPEKISSIGSLIPSTISLIRAGRHTHAVEGLTFKGGSNGATADIVAEANTEPSAR